MSIYSGPIGVAHTLRATLESAGFRAFIPCEYMKTLDPFITGANCLEVSVQVPAVDAEAVRDHLTAVRVEAAPEEPEGATEGRPSYVEAQLGRSVRRVVSRMKWAIVLQLMLLPQLPIPLLFVPGYVRIVGRMDALPSEHAIACAMFLGSLLVAAFHWAFGAAVVVGWE